MAGWLLVVFGILLTVVAIVFGWTGKGGVVVVKIPIPIPGVGVESVSVTGPMAVLLLAGGAAFVWGVIIVTSPSPQPVGQIVWPVSGDAVGRDIEARGFLADLPGDEHVWLVVRDGNLLYPQGSEMPPSDGEWSLRFHQGGTAKSISLELYQVDEEGNSFIAERLKAGDSSGIAQIPGAERLDIAENLRIRSSSPSSGAVPSDAVSATATSVHAPERGITYDAANTLDGNRNTAWNGEGHCIGCRLRYDFGRPRKLELVSLVNGYAKSGDAFQENARLKEVRFVMSGERQFRTTLQDTARPQDVSGDFGTTEYVVIEILSVYPGDEAGFDDAAVTEVNFFNE